MMKPRHHSLFLAAALCAFAPAALADQAAAAAAGVDLDVEYCESTGEQYIDTGVLGTAGRRVCAVPSNVEDGVLRFRVSTRGAEGGRIFYEIVR